MTFNIANSARILGSLTLQLTAAACAVPSSQLGVIGLLLTQHKKASSRAPKIVGCPIRGLNGPVRQPEMLPAWDDSRAEELYWEGYENCCSPSYCSNVANWGKNAGGAQATLLMLAIGEVFGVTGDSGFGLSGERTFHRPLPLVSTVVAAAGIEKRFANKVWQQTCDWVIREYGVTQSYLQSPYGNTMTLYRGVSGSLVEDTLLKGLEMPCRIAESWTSDYEIAEQFACRNGGNGYVITKEVAIQDIVLGYTAHKCLNENEEEFLVVSGGSLHPADVEWEKVRSYSGDDEDWYDYDESTDHWYQDSQEDPHGGDTWDGEGFLTQSEIQRRKEKSHDETLRMAESVGRLYYPF